MNNISSKIVLITILLCLLAGPAGAMVITVDDPVVTGSFDQKFHISYNNSFNNFNAHMTSFGNTFKGDGTRNFSISDWTGSLIKSDFVTAKGSDTNNLDFNFHFDGKIDQKLDFVFSVFDNKNIVDSLHCSYNGNGRKDGWDFEKVPEPTTMMLFGAGLLGLGIFRKKIIG